MPASDSLSLLIVDDHFGVRSSLAASLQMEPDLRVVGDIARGDEAVAAYQRTRPDVVLMDLQMPALDGVAATKALTDFHADARVLIYSTFERNDELMAAFSAGARGYVSKSAAREDLLQAIRAVAPRRRSKPCAAGCEGAPRNVMAAQGKRPDRSGNGG